MGEVMGLFWINKTVLRGLSMGFVAKAGNRSLTTALPIVVPTSPVIMIIQMDDGQIDVPNPEGAGALIILAYPALNSFRFAVL
ncbi:hypothetical protein KQX54_019679 [Cotesia glomerata]|uniref:Uncharacterized protein n=1 Tax=Cotesia glomerata TaxID=32391 RepID=A0AAV7I3X9_COTGL|nr:hypothetical protein KQX54_019679 [Cotesia glomerata]